MICTNGHENSVGGRFCGTCGIDMSTGGVGSTGFGVGNPNPPVQGDFFRKLKSGLLNDLMPFRQSSHPVTLQTILSMVSGALFAIAVFAMAIYSVGTSESDSPYTVGFFWTLLGCVGVYLVVHFVSSDLKVGATTAFVPLAAFAFIFLFGNSIEDGKVGWALLLAGIAYGAAWFLPILRGRPALLTSALLTFGLGLVTVMMQSSITGASDCSYGGNCIDDPAELFSAVARKSSTLMLIIGILFLAFAWVLDRKEWPSVGRIFIGVGIVFEISGAFGILNSSEDRTAASILLIIAGALLVLVAVQRSRKASLIVGGVGALIGAVAFISALTESNDNPTVFILMALITSGAVGFLCVKKSTQIEAAITSIGKP